MARTSQSSSGGGSGGGGALVLLVLMLGYFLVKYWYVTLVFVVCGVLLFVVARMRTTRDARHRPGRHDAWLNEVNVACAELDLREYARNQPPRRAGLATLGNTTLRTARVEVWIGLFGDAQLAHEAEIALRTEETTRLAVRRGQRVLLSRERLLFDAVGRGCSVDEFLLDEVVRTVSRLPVGPARPVTPARGR